MCDPKYVGVDESPEIDGFSGLSLRFDTQVDNRFLSSMNFSTMSGRSNR